MGWKELLYAQLPILLQHAVCSVEGSRIQRTRFSKVFFAYLAEAEARTRWSLEQCQEYRDKRLKQFVKYSYDNVPYYRQVFDQAGINPSQVQSLVELVKLPIMTKVQVQENLKSIISTAIPPHSRLHGHTSGTTGSGLNFFTTAAAIHEQWAIWWRYRRWHGIPFNAWCGYFGGRSIVPLHQKKKPFWRYNVPGRQIMFSAYHISPDTIDDYVSELRNRRPPWIHGYPSLLTLLASHIVEQGIDLGYRVQWVTIGAENLLRQQIQVMEQAFGVKPIQHYGLAEGVANISECPEGNFHVDEDFSAVEFVFDASSASYKVIGTNFTNLAMPMLRYDTGDRVVLSNVQCSCGRSGRLVASIDGRQEDYIILRNGARLGRMDHIFKDMIHVREAQLYQHTPGEVIFRVVRGDRYTDEDEKALLHEARERLGNDTSILFQYVDTLERSKTGKLRFVISDIDTARIDVAS